MKYTKEGIERSGEIWRKGLSKFPSSPLLKVKLGWHHLIRAVNFVSDDPRSDVRKAGELARQVLANEHLSPQVARLANWVVSYVLVRKRDFDGALGATDRAVALAPYDTFMLSSLMMVLVQAYSFRDPAILDRYALDLVQSGLPETNSVDWNSSGTALSKDSQPR